ncbi:MAG TPA: hypothetical protein VLH75_20480, partial [Longimicrobiales bacterium]|nr:hypothetical protein [Longimicrobiales bacterium]
ELWYRLRLYGVRACVHDWQSPEVLALFVATYTARLRWERFDSWGQRVVWFFGLPGLRRLNRAPFWIVARIFGRWGKPAHLQDRTVSATAADAARVHAITWGRLA